MIPRFFVSSTYYDLKHVRERLEKFIENYGFQPVLFESDRVTYQHNKEIDQSAYFEVELCHIVALIIGGRYGSSSSIEKTKEEKKLYDDNYISITRKEFETANRKNIPILIFIDKNVFAEYETYKENQAFFEEQLLSDKAKFKFAHVDHINVFKFIDVVKSKPIKTFDKIEEIEAYIKAQLAGMFYLHLESLKQNSNDKKILDTITELNNVALRMNEMLTSVGKEILSDDKLEYEKVINNQLEIVLDFYKEKFSSSIDFSTTLSDSELEELDLKDIARYIYEKSLKVQLPKLNIKADWNMYWKEKQDFITITIHDIQTYLLGKSNLLILKRYDFENVNTTLHKKVLPLIKDIKDEDRIIEKLEASLLDKLGLPF